MKIGFYTVLRKFHPSKISHYTVAVDDNFDLCREEDYQLNTLWGLMDIPLILQAIASTTVLLTLWGLSLQLFNVFHTEVGGAHMQLLSIEYMYCRQLNFQWLQLSQVKLPKLL